MHNKIKIILTLGACYALFFIFFPRQEGFLVPGLFRLSLKVILYLAYFTLFFILPGFLLISLSRFKDSQTATCLLSFPASVFIYFIGFSVYKSFGIPISRASFTVFAIAAPLILLLLNKRNPIRAEFRPKEINFYKLFWGVALIAAIFLIFKDNFCLEVFSGDGSEHLERALSLNSFFLPRAESGLTPGLWVVSVYLPAYFYSFFNFFILTLFGISEAVLRLPFLVFIFFLYYILCEIVQFSRDNLALKRSVLLYPAISVFLLLYATIAFLYTSSSGYFKDIIGAPNTDLIFSLFVILQIYFFEKSKPIPFLISAICSLIMLHTGFIFTTSILGFSFIINGEKRAIIKSILFKYMFIVTLGTAGFLLYGYIAGYLSDWIRVFQLEYFHDKILIKNSLGKILVFSKYFLVFIGIIPATVFLFISKDRLLRVLLAVACSYFILVMLSGHKNLHYFSTIALLPALVFIMQSDFPLKLLRNANFRLAIFLAFLISSFFLVAPKRIHSYDQARRFGGKTAILLKDYWKTYSPDAYRQGRAVTRIFRNLRLANPYVTWEKYARPVLTNETRFIFTDQPGKADYPDFELVDSHQGVYFFAKSEHLAELKNKEVPKARDFLNGFFADLWQYQ